MRSGEAEGAPGGGHRQRRGRKPATAVAAGARPTGAEPTPRHRLWTLRAHAPEGEALPTPITAVHRLRGPRVPGAGEPLPPGKVRVIYRDGRELTPCDRKKAEQEVALGRAKWVGASTIRLRYDPFRARRTRRRILERDGGVCAYCGAAGDTIDHLTPWSLGGRTTMDNCVTSCAECNFRRGNRPVIEFVAAEGITLRKMRNPVLLEYVRAARAQMRARRARTRDEDRAESS
ncbi:MAG: HNH endonuclease [Firmicutes bacterium]|nr:HNH endonuclease [Bacillota bacterium]